MSAMAIYSAANEEEYESRRLLHAHAEGRVSLDIEADPRYEALPIDVEPHEREHIWTWSLVLLVWVVAITSICMA